MPELEKRASRSFFFRSQIQPQDADGKDLRWCRVLDNEVKNRCEGAIFAPNFQSNERMKVLVTGSAGHLGEGMSIRLRELDYWPGIKSILLNIRSPLVMNFGADRSLKRRFIYYGDYAKADIYTLFSSDQLSKARKLTLEILGSCSMENNGKNQFELRRLPVEAQFSKVNGIVFDDLTGTPTKM